MTLGGSLYRTTTPVTRKAAPQRGLLAVNPVVEKSRLTGENRLDEAEAERSGGQNPDGTGCRVR